LVFIIFHEIFIKTGFKLTIPYLCKITIKWRHKQCFLSLDKRQCDHSHLTAKNTSQNQLDAILLL